VADVGDEGRTGAIGVVGATAIGIGGMVGGGIFAVLGLAAARAGGATPIAFVIGGVLAALTAVGYSHLSTRHPSAGGTVSFVDGAFGVNEVTGSLNVVLWAGYVAMVALYASAFGHYSAVLFPGGRNPNGVLLRSLILVGIAVPWLVNLANAGLVARTEGVIVAIKLVILGLVIAAGMPSVSSARLDPAGWPSWITVIGAGMLIFAAYEGFELIANASDDVRSRRVLPWSFGISVGLVTVLYVLIAVVVVGSLGPTDIARTQDFALAEAASATLGHVGFTLVAVSAMLATLSAINATLYGAARLSFTLASEGELPERFEHVRWREPIGLHVTAGAGLTIAVALPLGSISALASAIFLVVFAVTNLASARVAGRSRLLRAVGFAGAIGCLAACGVLIATTAVDDPTAVVALAGLVAAALGAEHLFMKHRRGRTMDLAPRHRGHGATDG